MKLGFRHSAFGHYFFAGLLGLMVLLAAGLFFVRVPNDPPGFSIDESSICYAPGLSLKPGRTNTGNHGPSSSGRSANIKAQALSISSRHCSASRGRASRRRDC
jgi:heme A synthase